MGCIMALPEGKGDGKWTVALEDPESGTYLFTLPVPPKLVESAGCLLDAMDMDDDSQKDDTPPKKGRKGTKKPEPVKSTSTTTTTEESRTTKEEKKDDEDKSAVKIHPIPANDFAGNSLARVSQIRNELQQKVDAMKADLENSGVSVKLEQEPENAPSSSTQTLSAAEVPNSATPIFPVRPPSVLPPLPDVDTSTFLRKPSFTSFSSSAISRPKEGGNLAALEKFSHPAREFAVQSNGKKNFHFNRDRNLDFEREVATANEEPDVFWTVLFTGTACLASALIAGILIHRCNKKGDELNMHLLVEEGLAE